MGLFSGAPVRSRPPEDRGLQWPEGFPLPSATVDFASIDANGESALRSIAVGAAIDLICSTSELPIDILRGHGQDRRELPFPGWLEDPGGDGQGIQDWLAQMLQSWLYRGNAFGEITARSATGRPVGISWFHPDSVRPTILDDGVAWLVNGRPFKPAEDFVHLRVNGVPGRLLGRSPIEQHAEQIGVSLASSRFGNQWFSDGAHPSGILVNSEVSMDQAQSDTAKSRFMALFRGSREPVVFGKGWDYKPIQIAPEDSQFLDTQRFSEAQCARIFGPAMPETLGYETGGSMTYANVVDRRSDLLTLTLNRWLRRADRVLTSMLPAPQYARINRDAFLESTTLARYEAHASALDNRWRTVNEIRAIEDLPPVPWGDTPNEKTNPTTPNPGGS